MAPLCPRPGTPIRHPPHSRQAAPGGPRPGVRPVTVGRPRVELGGEPFMTHAVRVSLTVNGTRQTMDVEPRRLLVHHLRDDLGLTGTHVGCDTSSCGACTVLVDGEAVKSCTLLAVQCEGAEVTTIEGMGDEQQLHPLQEAFWKNHGLQCGYC